MQWNSRTCAHGTVKNYKFSNKTPKARTPPRDMKKWLGLKLTSSKSPESPRRNKKTIIKVNTYILEPPPPQAPLRNEKVIIMVNTCSSKRPRSSPDGLKNTIICINTYHLEEPRRARANMEKQLLELGITSSKSPMRPPWRDEKTIIGASASAGRPNKKQTVCINECL